MGRLKRIINQDNVSRIINVINSLQKTEENDTVEDALLKEWREMNKKLLLQQHPYSISQYSDGRWKTYVDVSNGTLTTKRKQIARNTKKDLEEAVIEHILSTNEEYRKTQMTLQDLFEGWMQWRKECSTDPKTMKENYYDWKRFAMNDKIASFKVRSITNIELEDFFLKITANHSITSKRFIAIKGVFNGIFKYAVRNCIVDINPMLKIDSTLFKGRFKPVQNNKSVYTSEEREKILNHLEGRTDPYSLAISLAFCLCLRIGELTALKAEDLIDGSLYIRRSQRKYQIINEDMTLGATAYSYEERIKGNQASGFRTIPLSGRALKIIQTAISTYPNQEFLFMSKGKPILSDSFNERLRKVCKDLSIEYRSSHQIRFTVATKLSEAGVPINQLSVLLGHSETRTTFHYIRQREADENTAKIICNVLA